MKKISSLMICFSAALAMTGCGGGSSSPVNSVNTTLDSSNSVSKGTVAISDSGGYSHEIRVNNV